MQFVSNRQKPFHVIVRLYSTVGCGALVSVWWRRNDQVNRIGWYSGTFFSAVPKINVAVGKFPPLSTTLGLYWMVFIVTDLLR